MGFLDKFISKKAEEPKKEPGAAEFVLEAGRPVRLLRSNGTMDEVDAGWYIDVPPGGYPENSEFVLLSRKLNQKKSNGEELYNHRTVKRSDLEAWNKSVE